MGEDRVPKIGPGRPRKKPNSLAADRAYSNGPVREYLRRRGIRHTIPEVERAINRLKQHRTVATRYDKRRYVYLGTATAAALAIWLRT
ncbi:hypothetical protein AB0F26_31615 [Streptomyces venezuelae]|nr:hypothetical protein [Streptomyces venezuelae]